MSNILIFICLCFALQLVDLAPMQTQEMHVIRPARHGVCRLRFPMHMHHASLLHLRPRSADTLLTSETISLVLAAILHLHPLSRFSLLSPARPGNETLENANMSSYTISSCPTDTRLSITTLARCWNPAHGIYLSFCLSSSPTVMTSRSVFLRPLRRQLCGYLAMQASVSKRPR